MSKLRKIDIDLINKIEDVTVREYDNPANCISFATEELQRLKLILEMRTAYERLAAFYDANARGESSLESFFDEDCDEDCDEDETPKSSRYTDGHRDREARLERFFGSSGGMTLDEGALIGAGVAVAMSGMSDTSYDSSPYSSSDSSFGSSSDSSFD